MAYKIRKNKAGSKDKPYTAFSITLPAKLVGRINDAEGKEFEPRMIAAGDADHEGGILLEVVKPNGEDATEVPDWAR